MTFSGFCKWWKPTIEADPYGKMHCVMHMWFAAEQFRMQDDFGGQDFTR